MRVCASLAPSNVEDATAEAERALACGADMLELRLDMIDPLPDPASIGMPKGTIATLRSVAQGGRSTMDADERREYLSRCSVSFDVVDVEPDDAVPDGCGTIASEHLDHVPTLDEMYSTLARLSNRGTPKLACRCGTVADVVRMMDAARSFERDCVVIPMGEVGTVGRLRHVRLGSAFTFASYGRRTAEGQLSLEDMVSLGDDCVVLGIAGDPVSHSLSPTIQGTALERAGVSGRYLRFRTRAGEERELLRMMRELDVRGVNVTMPLKESVVDCLDHVSDVARRVGAVNTIVNDDGRMVGHNTDVDGVRGALGDGPWGSALVIGAGGAAKAALEALRDRCDDVHILDRTPERAAPLAERFGASLASRSELGGYDLIVNCTPVGMEGFEPGPLVPEDVVRRASDVMDMVYAPTMTPLLRIAEDAGARLHLGREMLVHQGAASFRLWTGVDADIDAMMGALP